MTRYQYDLGEHTIIVGYDPPLETLFAQVWGKGGERLGTHPLSWSGADGRRVSLADLRAQLKPYGGIPLELQLQLLRDQDERHPQPLKQLCRDLIDLCLEAPVARFSETVSELGMYYILLDSEGWHLRPWRFITQYQALKAFVREIYKNPSSSHRTEVVSSYVSDREIVLHVNERGVNDRLPLYARVKLSGLLPGYLFSGPVIVTGARGGLTREQVHTARQEIFFVEKTIRLGITDLWYTAWKTIGMRPYPDGETSEA